VGKYSYGKLPRNRPKIIPLRGQGFWFGGDTPGFLWDDPSESEGHQQSQEVSEEMAIIKVTLLFQQATNVSYPNRPSHRVAGWSESWYFSGSVAGAFAAVLGGAGLCVKRAALLPVGARIVGQRVQSVDPIGAAISQKNGFPGGAGLPSDVPQIALLQTVPSSSGRNVKHYLMRGVPDICVEEGEYTATPGFAVALAAYQIALGTFRFKGIDLTESVVDIVSVSAGGLITTIEPHEMVAGEEAIVTRSYTDSGNALASGTFKVVSDPTTTTLQLAGWTKGASSGGHLRRKTVIYPIIDGESITVDRVVMRKTGRPFDQYSGRR